MVPMVMPMSIFEVCVIRRRAYIGAKYCKMASPDLRYKGFIGALTVSWWMKNGKKNKNCCTLVSQQPLEVRFKDATELRVELVKHARPEQWEQVQIVKSDIGLTTPLYSAELEAAGHPLDFEQQATPFLSALRGAGRSRCAVRLQMRLGHY